MGLRHTIFQSCGSIVVKYVLLCPVCSLSIDMSVLYTASEETVASLHIVGGAMWLSQVSGCGY